MAAKDTKRKLKDAALKTIAEEGIAGTSARRIADRAGVNQALIFYHFGTIDDLLIKACRDITERRAALYRDRLSAVTTLAGLVAAARQLHDEERRMGNVTTLAQLLAGTRTRPRLGPPIRANIELIATEVRGVVTRVLDSTALAGMIAEEDLAHAVSALFIGIELLDVLETDDDRTDQLFGTLEQLARLAGGVLAPGIVPTRVLRRYLPRKREGKS